MFALLIPTILVVGLAALIYHATKRPKAEQAKEEPVLKPLTPEEQVQRRVSAEEWVTRNLSEQAKTKRKSSKPKPKGSSRPTAMIGQRIDTGIVKPKPVRLPAPAPYVPVQTPAPAPSTSSDDGSPFLTGVVVGAVIDNIISSDSSTSDFPSFSSSDSFSSSSSE